MVEVGCPTGDAAAASAAASPPPDTRPGAVAECVAEWREAAGRGGRNIAPDDARGWYGRSVGLSARLCAACDLIDALSNLLNDAEYERNAALAEPAETESRALADAIFESEHAE